MDRMKYLVLIPVVIGVMYVGIENQTTPKESVELPAKVIAGTVFSIIAVLAMVTYMVTRTDSRGNPR
jgi:hypothetical protein